MMTPFGKYGLSSAFTYYTTGAEAVVVEEAIYYTRYMCANMNDIAQ